MGSPAEGLIHRHTEIVQIVEGIKDADDVNTCIHRSGNEAANHIVGIVLIAQKILSAEKHLQLGVGHMLAEKGQALPRVFV